MPILKIDGDARGAVKASAEVAGGVKEVGKEATTTGEKFKALDRQMGQWGADGMKTMSELKREARELERAAGNIVRANEGPQERYNRKVAELSKLFVAGKLGVKDMDQALARYRAELTQVAPAQDSAFGGNALAMATSYFTGLFGPGAIVAGAIQMLRAYNNEVDGVAQQMQGGRAGLGQLTQLAAVSDDPAAKMKTLIDESKQFYNSGATTTLGEAGNLVFTLESANINEAKHRKLIGDMLSHGVIPEANQFSASIAALRSAYPDLAPDKLMGMGIVAAIPSPGGAEQIIQHSGKSGEQLDALGWKSEFGLAATSILSRTYGGASEGGSRLEMFMKNLEHEGFKNDPSLKGLDPFTILERIHAVAGDDRAKLEAYTGNRMESIQGYRTLYKNREELKRLTDLAGGAGVEVVDKAIELATNTPEIEDARQAISSRNKRATGRLHATSTAELIEAIRDQSVEGRGALGTGIVDAMTWLTRMRGEGAMEDVLRDTVANPKTYSQLSPDLMDDIRRHLRSIDEKTRNVPAPSGRPEK